jgi:hypothetical protein
MSNANCSGSLKLEAELWSRHRNDVIAEARKVSMLAEPALALLAKLAEAANGPVIELGPYIGSRVRNP